METPQAMLVQFWSGDLKYDLKNAAVVNTLGEILTQRYLKSIREDAGAAYSVGASASAEFGIRDQYMLQIYCPFKPALRDSVLSLMQQAIDDIAQSGVTEEELDKVKKFELKDYAGRSAQEQLLAGPHLDQSALEQRPANGLRGGCQGGFVGRHQGFREQRLAQAAQLHHREHAARRLRGGQISTSA